MHMAQQAAADKPKPSLPPGPKATTGDIVRPLAAAKGAMEAVDAHVDQTGAPGTRYWLDMLVPTARCCTEGAESVAV